MNEVPVFLTISVIAFCQMFNNPPNSAPKLNINHLSQRPVRLLIQLKYRAVPTYERTVWLNYAWLAKESVDLKVKHPIMNSIGRPGSRLRFLSLSHVCLTNDSHLSPYHSFWVNFVCTIFGSMELHVTLLTAIKKNHLQSEKRSLPKEKSIN